MNTIKVCCAIIFNNRKVLICQNKSSARHPLKWEFPGGKIEEQESESECLKREILEELAVEIDVLKRHASIYHIYDTFRLELIPFEARIIENTPIAKVHEKIRWINFNELDQIDWAETDKKLIEANSKLFNFSA